MHTINPATEEILDSYSLHSDEQVDQIIDDAYVSYQTWRKTSFSARGQLMRAAADLLKERKQVLASLMAQEMGKPITAGIVEIEKSAWLCQHYAEHAEHYLAPQYVNTEMKKSVVCYQPLGVVLGIMPWNFPVWQVFRYAVPTLMAGNTTLLKHAAISSGTGAAIAALFLDAGFPAQVFQQVLVDAAGAATIIAHQKIAAVTLTGSEQAGSVVASEAGRHLKRSVLELGGNDPYLVLADADLSLAASCIVKSRMNNCGQVCIAAKRIIVAQAILPELLEKIKIEVAGFVMGDPQDSATTLGPMARSDLRDTLQKQVNASVAQGAKLVLGGQIPPGKGYYYPPTILTEVKPGMPAFDEELFGPVISLISVVDEAEAIALANQTQYGLGAAVFTRDLERGMHIAMHEIESGICFVNAQVTSDPRLPFGGIKRSGYGRELAREGILEFVNTKTVCMNDAY